MNTLTPTPTCGELSCDECNNRTAALTAERDQLRAEVERLRSDRDCEKRLRKDAEELRENAIARAERAEAEAQRLKSDGAASTFVNMACRASSAEAEVSKLTDALDMMRDEFMRIIACPGCDAEIEDLANRAQLKLIQRVPVITQLDRAEAQLTAERARLKEMAAELAHCAGYIASVRTDRLITWHEELYALQTLEWAEGAFEIAEKANAVLEAHDAAMKEDAK